MCSTHYAIYDLTIRTNISISDVSVSSLLSKAIALRPVLAKKREGQQQRKKPQANWGSLKTASSARAAQSPISFLPCIKGRFCFSPSIQSPAALDGPVLSIERQRGAFFAHRVKALPRVVTRWRYASATTELLHNRPFLSIKYLPKHGGLFVNLPQIHWWMYWCGIRFSKIVLKLLFFCYRWRNISLLKLYVDKLKYHVWRP